MVEGGLRKGTVTLIELSSGFPCGIIRHRERNHLQLVRSAEGSHGSRREDGRRGGKGRA